jgi:hypothetical protein
LHKEAVQIIERTAFSIISINNYSCSGAETGQTPAQVPHSMQSAAFISYFVSPSLIQETGQDAAQAPHLIQASLILYAIKFTSFTYFR